MISRRQFLQGAVQAFASLAILATFFHVRRKPRVVFTVAGARFFSDHHDARSGETVLLLREVYEAQPCYRVATPLGDTIGYVPREYLQLVASRQGARWRIEIPDPHALPWKRYLVSSC